MTFDPNNFIFFYLILAIFALAIGLVAYASRPLNDREHKKHKS